MSYQYLLVCDIEHKCVWMCGILGCKNGQVYRSMVILIKSYEALESLFRKFLEIELGLRARQAC